MSAHSQDYRTGKGGTFKVASLLIMEECCIDSHQIAELASRANSLCLSGHLDLLQLNVIHTWARCLSFQWAVFSLGLFRVVHTTWLVPGNTFAPLGLNSNCRCSVLSDVVQVDLAQPDEGPDWSETSWVVLLLCNKWSFLEYIISVMENRMTLSSSPGHYQFLSHSRGEKLGEGLGSLLRHGPEMVDLVSMLREPSPPFPTHDIAMIPGLLPILLHSCEIKSGSGLGTRQG